jgi:hypothetical protein
MDVQKSLINRIQAILQGILSFAALIYATGFVVVNAHYTTFGVTDYQLIQTKYIAAGLSHLIIHLGIASMVAFMAIVIELRNNRIWGIIFLFIWVMFAVAVYLYEDNNVINSIIIGINACLITILGYQLWRLWTRASKENVQNFWLNIIPNNSQMIFLGIGLFLIVLASAISWGRSFWPFLTSSLGGGRPNEAVFVFSKENNDEAGLPFIPMQDSKTSEQLQILFEQPNEYVILVNIIKERPVAVRLSKSMISSVIYAPSELFGKKFQLPTITPEAKSP